MYSQADAKPPFSVTPLSNLPAPLDFGTSQPWSFAIVTLFCALSRPVALLFALAHLRSLSSGASGVSLHGGVKFKVEEAHFGCIKKAPGEPHKNEVKLRPPLCRTLKHSMTSNLRSFALFCMHFASDRV